MLHFLHSKQYDALKSGFDGTNGNPHTTFPGTTSATTLPLAHKEATFRHKETTSRQVAAKPQQ
jgi:hypothetical protein